MKTRKYIMAAAGTFMLLLLGTFFGWSLFRVSISEFFPDWGAASLSMNFTLFVVVFCFGSLFSGRVCDKLGRQKLLFGACFSVALGVFGVGFLMPRLYGTAALATLYICYGGLCGGGVGVGYNVIISGVSRWFPDRPGFISGLLLTGYGFGSLACGSAISALSGALGFWNAFLVFGLFLAVAVFACSFLFKSDAPPSALNAKGAVSHGSDYSTKEMLKTGKFWFLFGWALLTGCVGLMVINSSAVIAITFGVAATLGLLVSLFNGFGRIVAGVIYDKLGQVSTFAVEGVAFLAGALMVAAYFSGSPALMFGGMLCAGLSYGAAMAVIAAVIRDVFGTKYYASNFAVVTMAGIPSSFLGPFVSGLLQDAAGGEYLTTYFAMLVFALLGFLCAVAARRLKLSAGG